MDWLKQLYMYLLLVELHTRHFLKINKKNVSGCRTTKQLPPNPSLI